MISWEGKSLEEFPLPCLPQTPRGPHHQANYLRVYCANAAKALRHPVLNEASGCSAAQGSRRALKLLLVHRSKSVIPDLSVDMSKRILVGVWEVDTVQKNNDIFMIMTLSYTCVSLATTTSPFNDCNQVAAHWGPPLHLPTVIQQHHNTNINTQINTHSSL